MVGRGWAKALLFSAAVAAACDDPKPCTGSACVEDGGSDAGDSSTSPCNGPPGLYVPGSCTELLPGVVPFEPRYWLWSDAADKQRFVFLPAGAKIDTTNPGEWVFPSGTRFYKHFLLGGKRLETRVLIKTMSPAGQSSWQMRTYVWNEAQDTATEVVNGVTNVLGTHHDIPAQSDCAGCHRTTDVALGFTAVQLNHPNAGWTLTQLNSDARVSAFVSPAMAQVPGTQVQRDALGYLNANCGHCHDGTVYPEMGDPSTQMVLHLPYGFAADADVTTTPVYTTAVDTATTGWNVPDGIRANGANPVMSCILERMSSRVAGAQMPTLATEMVDAAGINTILLWIDSLQP